MTEQFPQTVAAAKRMQKDGWDLGDALLAECGPPGESSKKDGGMARVQAAAQELLENDMEFNTRYLAHLREICFKFPKNTRITSISWRAHAMAQTPEFLRSLVEGAPKGTKISGNYVRSMRQLQRKRDQQKRQDDHAAAEQEEADARAEARVAEQKERVARDDTERKAALAAKEKAKEKADMAREKKARSKTPPAKGKPRPFDHTDDLSIMIATQQFMTDATTARLAARSARKRIEKRLSEISQVELAAMVEEAMETFNSWKDIVDMLRKIQKKGSHLSVVNE